jgi:Cu(I)/Ag(I) efflux system membrane fusion protein
MLLLLVFGIFIGRCFTPLPEDHAAHASANAAAEQEEEAPEVWTCSMHPAIQAPKAGSCPICGMDLIPLESGGGSSEDGPHTLRLEEGQKALAGIRTTAAVRREMAHEVRLVGKLEVNETALATLSAWVGGRLDKLFVDYTGQEVAAGDPLAEIYSPDLFYMQEELIVATKAGGELAQATRKKLQLFGLSEAQMDEIIARGEPSDHITLTAPIGGTVIHRTAVEGAYVKEGAALFTIADLSQLWLQIDAFEPDLTWLSVDQTVKFEVDAWPGETFRGKISFIDPVLDPMTRTVRVRVDVDNQDSRLRPEMFVRARVLAMVGRGTIPLLIPVSAPLLTGDRAVVFVEMPGHELHGASVFEARDVVLGPRAGEYFVVVSGLEEGEMVVNRGSFTIDSEMQLRGKPSMMAPQGGGGGGGHAGMPGMGGGGKAMPPMKTQESKPVENMEGMDHSGQKQPMASESFRIQNGKLLLEAAALGEALASDDFAGSVASVKRLQDILAPLKGDAAPDDAMMALVGLRATAKAAAEAADIEALRVQFEKLQAPLVELATDFGYLQVERELAIFHCPMALEDGADWIDFKGDGTRNPYYGASMLKCGDETRAIPGFAQQK